LTRRINDSTICPMDDIQTAYRKLKDKQETLEPYMPIRMIAEILNTGHSVAQATIAELVKQGKAQKFSYGKGSKSRYRIL